MKVINPFFILGNPRSGTSLFRIILNAHPNIVVPPEAGFMQWLFPKYRNWSKESNNTQLNELLSDLYSTKKFELLDLNYEELRNNILIALPANYSELMQCIYTKYGGVKNVRLWGDKNNYYLGHIDTLTSLYPGAKFIHIIRDGRDVACSYRFLEQVVSRDVKYRPNLPSQIVAIAEQWKVNNSKIQEGLECKPHITIKFEDLILRTEVETRRALEFLDIPFSNNVTDYFLYNDEPLETLIWKRKTLCKPDPDSIGRYRLILSEEEICCFQETAGEMLQEFGYMLD